MARTRLPRLWQEIRSCGPGSWEAALRGGRSSGLRQESWVLALPLTHGGTLSMLGTCEFQPGASVLGAEQGSGTESAADRTGPCGPLTGLWLVS